MLTRTGAVDERWTDRMNANGQEPTISAYMQCYSNKRALYETLTSFRAFYETEAVTLVSDCGEDFSSFAEHFGLYYYWSDRKGDPRCLGKDGALEYLRRIYEHCTRATSDYVVMLEEDVITLRRIRQFPTTECAGPRHNRLAEPLNRYLQKLNNTTRKYGYAMCGACIFDRKVYMSCYEKDDFDLDFLMRLDKNIIRYSDVVLTVIFLVNGYSYSVWQEVSEAQHPNEHARIFRDAAFDHADKTWYDVEFDESLLTGTGGAR